jgi:hypothetical protein
MIDPLAFSAKDALAQLLEDDEMRSGKRLSFPEQCAAFAAMQNGVRQKIVREAFGLSDAAVSYLANCARARDGRRQVHYPHVAREFERLGAEAFRDAYFTDDTWTRLKRIKHDMAQKEDKRPRGPNPRADSQSFAARGAFPLDGPLGLREYWRIDWNNGWRYHCCLPTGELTGNMPYQGMESVTDCEPRPFRTSIAALEGLEKMLGLRE